VFFGAAALTFRKGVKVFDPEAPRALLYSGRQRILVIDSSKINQEATYGFCPLDQCDLVITDSGIDPSELQQLQESVKVIVAR
jgi:DeoR/GlpR family transcriptional regulator of sugar metabolism